MRPKDTSLAKILEGFFIPIDLNSLEASISPTDLYLRKYFRTVSSSSLKLFKALVGFSLLCANSEHLIVVSIKVVMFYYLGCLSVTDAH